MPAYHVERSITIDAPESKVRSAVEDYAEWPKWSPWLYMEPSATVNVHGTAGQIGHGYDWSGELVGAGSMETVEIEPNRIRMDLEFLKPFKSRAKVEMEIRPVTEEQTEVTWHMFGKLPIFLFFMTGMMKAMIGMDYKRGLKMLKDYVEKGSINSSTEVVGIVDFEATDFVGVEDQCPMDQLGESMGITIPAAHCLATENGMEICGAPAAVYNHMDMKAESCKYTAIIPVTSTKRIDGGVAGSIPTCKALKVIHKGSYEHLGNSWSTAMAHQRHDKLKPSRVQKPFEVYVNDPGENPEEELLTEIYIPIRG